MKNLPMIIIIKDLLFLIDREFYLKFGFLQFLIIISGLLETVSFFSILPLINLIVEPESINSGIVSFLYNLSGVQSDNDFILYFAIVILIALVLSLVLTISRIWLTTLFANTIGFRIGDDLFSYYLKKEYDFHTEKNSSYLTKQITVEAIRIKNIIKAFMQLNSDLFMVTLIILGLIYYDTITTLILISSVGFIYFIMHRYVSGILLSSGRRVSSEVKERFIIINNSLGGIADIIRASCSDHFIGKMQITGRALARSTTIGQVLGLAPAKVLQTLILVMIIAVILHQIIFAGDVKQLIIASSAFVMAGYKIMPMFQSIYSSLATIKTNSPAIDAIKQDLSADFNQVQSKDLQKTDKMSGDIILENVTYKHLSSANNTIRSINAVIKQGQILGIIGPTGSGKSTLINLITSLVAPDSGVLKVGDVIVDASNSHIWKNSIAVIAQDIFLIDGTIAENIAFGIDVADIDMDKVKRCILRANMENFVSGLPKAEYSKVGERGVQLSGGQKQRIAIARALYRDAKYLIMDEGTSSLDQDTERQIINELLSLHKDITLIMVAHRLNTLSECDVIYILKDGALVEQGTFRNIIENQDLL